MAADDHADSFDFPIGAQVLTAFPVRPTSHLSLPAIPAPLPEIQAEAQLSLDSPVVGL